jgi:hypothetical protein
MSTVIDAGRMETIEVRRNWQKYPADAPSGLSTYGGYRSVLTNPGGYLRATVNETAPNASGVSGSSNIIAMPAAAAGEPWRWSADVRGTVAGGLVLVAMQFYNSAGTYISNSQMNGTPVAVNATDWVEASVSSIAPADAAYTRVIIVVSGTSTVGDVLDVRRITAEKTATRLGAPFSGAASPDPGLTVSWDGTPFASESIAWLTRPVQVEPILVDGYETTRAARSVVHTVVGRTFPDVTLRAPGPRRGALRMLFATEAEAVRAFAILSEPRAFTLSEPDLPGIGMRFVVADGDLSAGLDDTTRRVWWVRVPFVEVEG